MIRVATGKLMNVAPLTSVTKLSNDNITTDASKESETRKASCTPV